MVTNEAFKDIKKILHYIKAKKGTKENTKEEKERK